MTAADKWLSAPTSPAECRQCHRMSFVPTITSSGILAASAILLTAVGFAAMATHSYAVGLVGLLCVMVLYGWRWRAAPLTPTSSANVASARRVGWFMSLVALALAFLQ